MKFLLPVLSGIVLALLPGSVYSQAPIMETAPQRSVRVASVAYVVNYGFDTYRADFDLWSQTLSNGPVASPEPLDDWQLSQELAGTHYNSGLGLELGLQHRSKKHNGLHPNREMVVGLYAQPQSAWGAMIIHHDTIDGLVQRKELTVTYPYNEYRMRLGYLFQSNAERRFRATTGPMLSTSFISARKAHMAYDEIVYPAEFFGIAQARTAAQFEESYDARNGWSMYGWVPVRLTYRFIPYAEVMVEATAGTGWMKPGGTDVVRTRYSAAVSGGVRFLPGR